jgi:hypothetical protein
LGIARLTAAISEDLLQTGVLTDLFGDDVKPLIDTIDINELGDSLGLKLPSAITWNVQDLFLLAYGSESIAYNNFVLVRNIAQGQGFWRLTALPGGQEVITLKEVQATTGGSTQILALTADKKVWSLFSGTQDGTVTAVAVTQPLPTPSDLDPSLWDTDKVFNEMYVEGVDLANFEVSFSLDQGVTFNTPQPLTKRFRIGLRGKSLTIKFTHSVETSTTPLLSFLKVLYNVLGVTAS